jgi:DinB superfamily
MDLRYPIGKFEMPPSLSPAERAAALQTLTDAPADLRSVLEGLDEAHIDTPYRPGGWTVRQVVHHLPDSHMNSYVRFKLGLTEDEPTIGTYDEKAWAELPDSRGPIEVSVRLLTALHERWVSLLATLDDDAWARRVCHPEFGQLRLDQLLALYDWHSRHHVAHIRSLRDRRGW